MDRHVEGRLLMALRQILSWKGHIGLATTSQEVIEEKKKVLRNRSREMALFTLHRSGYKQQQEKRNTSLSECFIRLDSWYYYKVSAPHFSRTYS